LGLNPGRGAQAHASEGRSGFAGKAKMLRRRPIKGLVQCRGIHYHQPVVGIGQRMCGGGVTAAVM